MRDLEVGRLRVGAVVETAGPTRPTWLFPSATPEAVDRHRAWLAPHFLDAEGRLLQSVHTFVVKAPDLTVLVDTCIGNDKDRGGRRPFHMLRTGFLDTLRAAGVTPEAVDVVICTHLHVDHVGWNTRLDSGRWVPTFPRARYLFARREWEHWTTEDDDGTRRIMADSVAPVLDAGLAELVDTGHKVTPEVWLEPTPGHTPGHVSVRVSSKGQDAVITGHDRNEVGALVFLSPAAKDLAPQALRAKIAAALQALAAEGGSSMHPVRALILEEPPSIDAGEITDKGYINQRAVLESRAALVDRLHEGGDDVVR